MKLGDDDGDDEDEERETTVCKCVRVALATFFLWPMENATVASQCDGPGDASEQTAATRTTTATSVVQVAVLDARWLCETRQEEGAGRS